MDKIGVNYISCPYCHSDKPKPWAKENGFYAVQCGFCGLIYVNPRPSQTIISVGVESGYHAEVPGGRSVVGNPQSKKIAIYRHVFAEIFKDVWSKNQAMSWLDIGAGFGEIVQAVSSLAPAGSRVWGIEPMGPKAKVAQKLGVDVREGYLNSITERFDIVSLINVFSHLPDFYGFLDQIKSVLKDKGEIYLETGNLADLPGSHKAPTILNLPDHLVFAGENHIIGYLEKAGFEIIKITRIRNDTILNCVKQIIRKLQGQQRPLIIPYTSGSLSLRIRAKLK